jgi:O-antigen ligase
VSVTIIGVLGVMFARSGINPASVLAEAVSEARFQPILLAFRFIHEDVNENAATSTLRHFEVRAMVVASLLGIAMLGSHSRRSSWLLAGSSFVLASAAAFVTFSRGNILALSVAVLPALVWWLRRVAVRWRVAVIGAVVAIGVGLLQVGVVADALWEKSNDSSEVRGERLEQSLELLDDGVWTGVAKFLPDGRRLESPHNIVLDLWLGGGVAAALCGAILVVLAVVLTIRIGARALRADHLEPLMAWSAVFGLMGLVVIRMLTGGGGMLDPVSWFGFGAVLAIRTAHDGAFAQPSPSTRAPEPN